MNLAIKGHYTRGKEIIKILEMLGGINLRKLEGIDPNYYYTIENDGTILGRVSTHLCNKHVSYTIEEFLEKYPYKVGDKVLINDDENDVYTITSMRWNGSRVVYKIIAFDGIDDVHEWFADEMNPYKEETMVEQKKDYEEWCPTDYLEFENNDDTWADEVEVNLGKDYEIQIRGDKTFIVKKQPQYPKTYEECCEVLRIPKNEHYIDIDAPLVPSDYNRLVSAFTKLLIYRDAYWKIAGKQKGWGNPWEPDSKNKVYYIFYCISNNTIKLSEGNLYSNVVLAFPTKEMRDAFLENFKELIEQCKELL